MEQANPPSVPMPAAAPNDGQLPKANQIFSEAWKIYKFRLKTLLAISAIPLVAYIVFIALAGGGLFAASALKVNLPALGIFGLVLFFIAAIFLIYLGVWGAVATLYAIKDREEQIGWKEAYRRSRGKLGAFFATGLLAALAIMGGFILLIVPGIIFSLWFSQSSYVVIEEGLSGGAALKRSKYYVKGRMGTVFGKGFYLALITILLYIVIGMGVGLLQKITGLPMAWIGNIFSFFWSPLAVIYGYLVFSYLKATRP